jgi:predicted PurR-regulated permease PerM
VNLALEASIHIGLAILLSTACLLILRPFLPLLAWGIIIALSAYPVFQKLIGITNFNRPKSGAKFLTHLAEMRAYGAN